MILLQVSCRRKSTTFTFFSPAVQLASLERIRSTEARHFGRLDEFDPEASIQQIEEETGLSFVVDMDQVREVVLNARSQRAGITEEQLVEALAYFYERDVFLEI